MSDREIREAERAHAADPSDEAAAERARALRWRAGRPTVKDRLAAILADPEVRAAHWDAVWPAWNEAPEIVALAEPFVRGATLGEMIEVAYALAKFFGWSRPEAAGSAAAFWSRKAEGL